MIDEVERVIILVIERESERELTDRKRVCVIIGDVALIGRYQLLVNRGEEVLVGCSNCSFNQKLRDLV